MENTIQKEMNDKHRIHAVCASCMEEEEWQQKHKELQTCW
jgi:hypothetical protein